MKKKEQKKTFFYSYTTPKCNRKHQLVFQESNNYK